MQKIKQIITGTKQIILQNFKYYYTSKVMKLYEKQKYTEISEFVHNINNYNLFELNDHKLLFFLISEQNNQLISDILINNKNKDIILNDDQNPNKFYPITFALLNNLQTTAQLLLDNGDDIHKKHQDGSNLLHMCAFYNKIEPLQFLVEKGIDINQQNDRGDTPLHLAAIKNSTQIIEYLLKNRAQVDLENLEKNQPIHEAVIFDQFDSYLLLKPYYKGLRVKSNTLHIVHQAAMLDNKRILEDIINDNSAVLNLRDERSKATPLHFSINANSLECTRFLLDKGAIVNAQDCNGNTPIHLAVESKQIELCKELCKYKADPTIENDDKLSAIDIAESERDKQILSYFKSVPYLVNYFMKN